MKKITLKIEKMKIPAAEEAVDFSYLDVMLTILGGPVQQGVTLVEQKADIDLMNILEKAKEDKKAEVFMEDKDWQHLNHRIQQHKFPFSNKVLYAFGEDIKNAEVYDPNKAEASTSKPSEGKGAARRSQ